jgi:hypothetical protein
MSGAFEGSLKKILFGKGLDLQKYLEIHLKAVSSQQNLKKKKLCGTNPEKPAEEKIV